MNVKFLSFLFVSIMLLFACEKDEFANNEAGEITTLAPHSWTQNMEGSMTSFASLRGNYVGGATGELGFFFSTNQINTESLASETPQGIEKYVVEGTENNIFTCEISGLEMGTRYYFVAYIKLASGKYKFGEVKDFFVNNLDILQAGKPAAIAVADSYKTATITITPGSFGAGPSLGDDTKFLKIYETGVYLWMDKSGSLATATKVRLQADRAMLDLIKEGDDVSLNLISLISDTKYNFVPYVQMAFCKALSDTLKMEPVLGDQGSFTTLVAENLHPAVTTVGASNITQTGGTLSGKVTDFADDLSPEVGFYLATTEDALNEHNETDKITVTNLALDGAFTCTLTGLTDNKTYYYKSYMIWRKGTADETVIYGEAMNFTTIKIPVVGPAFARVDAILTDWSGKYLIVYEAQAVGANTYAGTTVLTFKGGKDGAPVDGAGNIVVLSPSIPGTSGDLTLITGAKVDKTSTDITVTGGIIQWREELESAVITITAVEGGGWSLKTAGGYYIGASGNTGSLNANTVFSASAHLHTISIGTTTSKVAGNTGINFNNCAIIGNSSDSFMRVNGGTGRFGYWSDGNQHPVALYKAIE